MFTLTEHVGILGVVIFLDIFNNRYASHCACCDNNLGVRNEMQTRSLLFCSRLFIFVRAQNSLRVRTGANERVIS